MIVLFEVERIHAENIIVYFLLLSRHFPGGNEESLSQDSGYLLSIRQITASVSMPQGRISFLRKMMEVVVMIPKEITCVDAGYKTVKLFSCRFEFLLHILQIFSSLTLKFWGSSCLFLLTWYRYVLRSEQVRRVHIA